MTVAITYGVVIAHEDGQAHERILAGITCTTLADAERHAETWTRKHARTGETGMPDHLGFYAYGDRTSGARAVGYGGRMLTTRYGK